MRTKMSEETKNPLIKFFLKLHEDSKTRRVTPGVTPQVNGEYDRFGNLRAPYVKQYGEYAKSRLSAPKTSLSSLPDDDPFAAEKAQVQKRADEFNKNQELKKQQDTASQLNVPLAQVRTIPSQTGVGRANTPVGGYQAKPPVPPVKSGGTSAITGFKSGPLPANFDGKRSFADKTSDIEKEFSVAKPGTTKYNLRVGSSGKDVEELQRSLGITADGKYGPQTAAAVEKFQQDQGLKVDRIAGDQTMSKIKQIGALRNLRDADPSGAADQASKQISSAKPIGSSIQTSSPIGGNRIFPSINSTTSSGGFSTPTTPTNKIVPNSSINLTKKPSTLMAHYEPGGDMPSKIIEAFMKLHSKNPTDLFAEAKKAKKLDAVGKEDEDIDNDGDKDKSDSYLHNRRKKIAAAMKEAIDPKVRPPVKKDPYGGDETSPSSMGIDKPDYAPAGTTPDYAKPKLKPSVVKQTGKNSSEVYKQQAEEVEQLDEAAFKLTDAHKKAITTHLNRNIGKGKVTFHKEHGGHFATHSDGIQSTVHHIQMKNGKMTLSHFMTMDEQVEFSEAELEHFAAILEGPVAPTPDGHDVKAFGSSTSISGTLTDEAIAEEEKKKRGRKPGVKVGAYGPRGAKKGEGEATTNVSVPHVFHQIRTSRADSQGNYNLQHEHGGKTLNAKVSARDAAEFSKKYMNTEKPREKEAHTDAFVAKHFGVSKPKAAGITLPKMPSAKS